MAGEAFITLDSAGIRELERTVGQHLPKELDRARSIALNRTRRGAGTRVSQWIRTKGPKLYNIPAGRIKQGLTVTRVQNRESFRVIGSRKPISLTSFSGTRDLAASGKGVSVAILKGKRVRIASAFIRQPTGGAQVYRRRFVSGQSGAQFGRYPIRRLIGPSVATMMDQTKVEQDLVGFLFDRYETELDRAIRLALRRRG